MAVRGVKLYKIVFPEDSALGTTIYDCDPITGEVQNEQDAIWFGPNALGEIFVETDAWTDAELGLKTCYKRSSDTDDYTAFKNEDGSYDSGGDRSCVVSGIATDATGSYCMSPRWADAGWAILHSVDEATGNDVAQTGADKTIYLLVKS